MVLALASVTDSLVTVATHVIRDMGLAGILLLIALSGVIGVPGTELPMLFAGFNVYEHHLTLVGVIAAGVAGDTLGASAAYAIGRFGRRELFERHGRKLRVTPAHLAVADRWFARRGAVTIVVSRWFPLVRAVFPFAAGVARMRYPRFALLATLGSIPWIAGLAILGREVGSSWESWRRHLDYVDYGAVVLLVLAVAYLIFKHARSGSEKPARDVV